MSYWKFLRAGTVSPFTGFVWPAPGEWVDAGPIATCRDGVHACRLGDLPYWLVGELWRVELSDPVIEGRHKVVAARARLVDRVTAWNDHTARELALACLHRAVHHASVELRASGLDTAAQRLASSAGTSEEPTAALADVAAECEREAKARRARLAARLCGYVSDAVNGFGTYPVASLAYIAARAANLRSSAPDHDPYSAERAWQAEWLASRLSLA